MSLAEELPVYKAGYDLVLAIFEQARDFMRAFREIIGETSRMERAQWTHFEAGGG